jgi:type IV pilus assembly protein PilE
MLSQRKLYRGFTLIELMITVAIVAILAAIAYPSYTKYVQRGYRSEALAQLNDAVARTERFYAQNNTYAGATLAALGMVTDADIKATGKSNATATDVTAVNSTNSRYKLSVVSTTATTYKFQTVPQGTQANDTCGTLAIDQAGNKTSTGGTDCFK